MIGKTIFHYKILEKIGEGGMGVVYLAEDTKLDRKVALKFLPQQFSINEEEKSRFIQEAKAAAALDHTNICNVYEIDETKDGQMFIAMGYYKGVTLRDKIKKGPLTIEEALKIAIQVSEGLHEAHEKGIVHRDIKSANIIITDKGTVKILDFGLAKLKGQSKLTKVGTTVGTAAYMSPEQAKGAIVDHRSDIWSLGVVLYEMVTGQLPFKGDYEQAVIYSILNEEPEPVSTHRTDVPVELEQIINKALAKNPAERYQLTEHLLEDARKVKEDTTPEFSVSKIDSGTGISSKISRRSFIAVAVILAAAMLWIFVQWQSPSDDVKSEDLKANSVNKIKPVPKRKMIVVLPFENLGSPEDEYFADGITEEIQVRLARLKGLSAIARLSAKQYKKTNKTPQIIGRELGVDYLIEGTIRWQRSADKSSRVRITLQLIKTSDANQIWADVYEKDLRDIFAIQAFIAEQVASSLDITLLEGQRKALAVRPTKNMKAYNYYLRGNFLLNRDSMRSTCFEALKMYKNAVELDPLFAEPWAMISTMHSIIYHFYYNRTDQRLEKAKKAANRAFELSPELPRAYISMGYYFYIQMDFENALDQYKKAEKWLGENSVLLLYIGIVKRRQGHWKDAEELFFRAFKLNPRATFIVWELAVTKRLLRNYQGSEHLLDLSFSLNPDRLDLYTDKILNTLLWKGDTVQGMNFLNKANQKFSMTKDQYFLNIVIIRYLCSRNYQKALKLISTISKESFDLQEVFTPKSLAAGQIYQYMKKSALAIKEYKIARRILHNHIKENPKDSRLHSSLGIAFAGLGEINDAVKEGELGVELMPIKKDALIGFRRLIDLAQIYTMVGAENKAIDQLEHLLSIPSVISIALLKIDPRWDPLRKNPRFKKLLKEGKQYSYISDSQ